MTENDAITTMPSGLDHDLISVFAAKVASVERTQRAEDVDGFLDLVDVDAHWVNGVGRRLVGKPAIAEATRAGLPGAFATGSVNYVLRHVHLIGPDVVLTGVAQTYVDDDGEPLADDAHGSPTYIWRRSAEGQWLIVAGQNTAVVEN